MNFHSPDSAVDIGRLARWMDERAIADGAISGASLLSGGTQNILLRFERGARRFILRRPPLNPRPESEKTILREARMLAAICQKSL